MNWYNEEVASIFGKLNTSEKGISEHEASKRKDIYGENKLPDSDKISILNIIIHQFKSPLIYILFVAGIVTILLKEYIDSTVIFAVVLLNAIIGFYQELKAEKSVKALKNMLVPQAKVIRDGKEYEISSTELVPGDIVLIASGLRVPADLRLIETIELKIDESMLTGESIPAEKNSDVMNQKNVMPADQRNMAFMGTIVVSGRAKGVVVATGSNTELGKIAKNIFETESSKAPVQQKIEQFTKAIAVLVLVSSLVIFLSGILLGESIKSMFLTAIAVAVAAVPEGLPIVVTIAMAVGVARMARQNAIVRKLVAVETLGSTTAIGSDKTGTLTKNEMTVKKIFVNNKIFEVEGVGYNPEGKILDVANDQLNNMKDNLHLTLIIGALCNESSIYQEDGIYKISGDPTEAALIVSAMKGGIDIDKYKSDYPQLSIIPFESERGFMLTIHKGVGKNYLFMKGAVEKLINLCNFQNENEKDKILQMADDFASEGMRVLGFAYSEIPEDITKITCKDLESCDIIKNLTFTGLQAMIDPPRPEVIEAINGCKSSGIRVLMITGDHALTAKAIAKQIGIEGDNVITGKQIETLSDEQLLEKVKYTNVFARVTPEHKLRIVNLLKQLGHIVAVTGDGVNDAPALKSAHIGVAMGRSGTDVAKEAADMVLTDDNFATIYKAVKEGRIVFDNIRKVTFFLIPTGVASILSVIGTMIMGLPIPFVPAQLLWINIVTNGLQDVSLAFEPGEKDIEKRAPRDPKEPIMSKLLIERTVIIGILIAIGVLYIFYTEMKNGASLEKARTMAMTTMVFFQFFQAINSRSETLSIFQINPFSNRFLLFSLLAATIAQISVVYIDQLRWVFRTEAITFGEWIKIIMISLSVIVIVEIDKYIRKNLQKKFRV